MRCPVCHTALAVVEFRAVELDVCPACRGLWFDADELRVFFAQLGSGDGMGVEARLRALPPSRAARKLRCPRCSRRLVEFVADAGPPRLVLDRCARGDGLWFDRSELARLVAGSLRDGGALEAVREFLGEFAEVEPS